MAAVSGHSVLILYASQTGNAQSIAEGLKEEAEEKGFNASVHCTNEFDKDKVSGRARLVQVPCRLAVCATCYPPPLLCLHFPLPLLQFPFAQERNIIFVVSTTGEGEPPDHALRYWRKLKRKTLPPDFLTHINYTLLGEGSVCWGLRSVSALTYATLNIMPCKQKGSIGNHLS